MHSRCNGPILLGVVVLCVALAVMETSIVGPKMCERLCNIYRTSDLSCQPTQAMLHKQKPEKGDYLINATKGKEGMHAENAVDCREGGKIFRTRRHSIKCRPILPNHPTLTSKDGETRGRILMLFYGKKNHRGRQIFLGNKSVVPYPFIQSGKILAIAYIPSDRKLVVASQVAPFLFFTPIDNRDQTNINAYWFIKTFAIDDDKQLVFMKVMRPKEFVGVMSTHGKNIKSLFSIKSICHFTINDGFAADHKRFLIYVLCYCDGIFQFTYEGVPKGQLVGHKPLNFVMQGDFLYYQSLSKVEIHVLYKFSLSDHSVTPFTTLKLPYIDTSLFVDNIMYIVPRTFKGDLLVVNMSDVGTVTKIDTDLRGKSYQPKIRMCLIS